jgi:hypothetical protein
MPGPARRRKSARAYRTCSAERRIGATRAAFGMLAVADVAFEWHDRGMARTRLSTTVDRDLLDHARRTRVGASDAELIDEALAALLAQHRAAEIDAAYASAYGAHPIDEPDEWGDLESFRGAVAR